MTARQLGSALLNAASVVWVVTAAITVGLQLIDLESNLDVALFEAFTPYVFIPGYVLLVALLLRRRRRLALATVPLLLYQVLGTVAVLTGVGRPAGVADSSVHLRIFTQNVQGAVNRTFDKTVAGIVDSDADIVVLEEVTQPFLDKLVGTGAIDRYHFQFFAVDRIVLSTVPLAGPTSLDSEGDVSRSDKMAVTFKGRSFALYAVHMTTPYQSGGTWRAGFAALQNSLSTTSGPVVVVGDFNATLSHHALRNIIGSGYRDAASDLGRPFDRSWPAKSGWTAWLGGIIGIDHVLLRGVAPVAIATGPANGSDHTSLTVDIALPG